MGSEMCIRDRDVSEAQAAEGVHAVFTANDFPDLKDLRCINFLKQVDGSDPDFRDIPPLCRDTVHHVGDAIAMVVAESVLLARDAIELIVIDYESLEAVVDTESALAEDAPTVAEDRSDNISYTHFLGNKEATDAAMETAAHVVDIKVCNNRLISNCLLYTSPSPRDRTRSRMPSSA